jgi:predicted amidohydrolase YtcJ
MQAAFEAYLATGVTGAIEMAGTTEHLEALEALYIRHGKSLPIRTWVHIIITVEGTAEDRLRRVDETIAHRERLRKAEMDEWLQVVGIKIISDGVIDACKPKTFQSVY